MAAHKRRLLEAGPTVSANEGPDQPARQGSGGRKFERDLIALSTLPAIWHSSPPIRIAESLLAAIQATLEPELCFIELQIGHLPQPDQATRASLRGVVLEERVTNQIRKTIGEWAKVHSVDEILRLRHKSLGEQTFAMHVHPLGFEAEYGALAAAFPGGREPTVEERTLLNLVSNQAIVACKNTELHRRAEEEIRVRKRAEEALRAADKRKDEFLATLAHELRNPLAPLSNGVEILAGAAEEPAMVRRISELMRRQVFQLRRLVDDLLDVSRITRDKLVLKEDQVVLQRVIEDAVLACTHLCEGKNHELTVSAPEEPMVLQADSARLTQVVGNLLSNACHYTPPDGRIEVVLAKNGKEAVIQVKDNGLGIARNQLESVFEPFVQLGTTSEAIHGGLGIGLSLVRRLVEMHGGTVRAESAGAHKGSVFTVRLPLNGAADSHPSVRTDGTSESGQVLRVLVVDDNVDAATSLAQLLEISGHETQVAHDGESALEFAKSFRPELVLLDIGLPGMNGFEVCRKLREEEWGRRALVVAVSGWGQEVHREKSRESGFDAHYVKPVDLETVLKIAALGPRSANGTQKEPGALS
jgi:signal transduction histidine kinase/ActR/RegA family two-component response regulator